MQDEIGVHGELGAGDGLELRRRADPHGVQLLDVAIVVAGKLRGGDAPVANAAFFVRAFDSQLHRPQRPRR